MTVLLISLGAALVILSIVKLSIRPPNFPPGPRGMPLLGYITPLLSKKEPFYKILQNLAKTYGPVTGFYIGPKAFVSVVGQEAVREALQNNDLNSRPSGTPLLRSLTFGKELGLAMAKGDFWEEQRRFSHRNMRELGFGKSSIEDQMMEEINDLILEMSETAKSNAEHVVDFNDIFKLSIVNIVWGIVGLKCYRRSDPTFKKLFDSIDEFLQSGGNIVIGNLPIPEFLIHVFPSLPRILGMKTELFSSIQKIIMDTLDEHESMRSKGDSPRDFIDAYLDEMEEQSQKNSNSTFSRIQLISIIQDLFAAGSHTTSSAMEYMVLYMVHYPEIQQKMRNEQEVVCGDSYPSLAHRLDMPYTEAVLMEIMRMSNVTPLTVPHCAMNDTQLQGFIIPKGTVLSIHLGSANKDDTAWKDPENFRPERHLDQEGNLIRNDAFIPFGLGKRMCFGEPFARNALFLFMASLVKTFEFKPVPNEPYPTLEPKTSGFLTSPYPFKAVVVQRVH